MLDFHVWIFERITSQIWFANDHNQYPCFLGLTGSSSYINMDSDTFLCYSRSIITHKHTPPCGSKFPISLLSSLRRTKHTTWQFETWLKELQLFVESKENEEPLQFLANGFPAIGGQSMCPDTSVTVLQMRVNALISTHACVGCRYCTCVLYLHACTPGPPATAVHFGNRHVLFNELYVYVCVHVLCL
jgi:hypothetical protein